MKGNGLMTKKKAGAITNGLMVKLTTANGKMTRSTEKATTNMLEEMNILVSINLI